MTPQRRREIIWCIEDLESSGEDDAASIITELLAENDNLRDQINNLQLTT